jgi:hypothetical protein
MFFQKSIISFVAVAALAASVSASSIAARQAVQCPAGLEAYCCPQPLPFTSLPSGPQGALPGAAPSLDQSKEVCENFSTPSGTGWYCVFPPLFFSHRMNMAHVPHCPCSPNGQTPLCCAGSVTAGQYLFILTVSVWSLLTDKLIIRWREYYL